MNGRHQRGDIRPEGRPQYTASKMLKALWTVVGLHLANAFVWNMKSRT
jgi:hypothetical protein